MATKFIYFAYGSNMLCRRLRSPDRAPSATTIGIGFVSGRRLTFDKVSTDKSGKCDIEPTNNPNDRAYGVIFEVDLKDKDQLDVAEGKGKGYEEAHVTVITPSGNREAITYVATTKDPALKPYHWYKALVIAGAVENSLPQPYVEWLRTFDSTPDPNATRRAENEQLLFCN